MRLTRALQLLACILCLTASINSAFAKIDSTTILIESEAQALSDEVCLVGGKGVSLEPAALQHYIDNGYRIIDAALTADGWTFVFTKNSGIKDQVFIYEPEIPDDWMEEYFAKGYSLSALILDDNLNHFVLMSEDPSIIDEQIIVMDYFDDVCAAYDSLVEEGYSVTFAHPIAELWLWVFSKSNLRKQQDAFTVEMPHLYEAITQRVQSQGYALHNIINCQGFAVVFYGTPNARDGGKIQSIVQDPDNIRRHITKDKERGTYIAHMTGKLGVALRNDGNDGALQSQLFTTLFQESPLGMGMQLFDIFTGGGSSSSHGKDSDKTDCSSCHGSGHCTYCNGTGLKYGETCPDCNGSGSCSRCRGNGYVDKDMGDYMLDNFSEGLDEYLDSKFSANKAQTPALQLSERWSPVRVNGRQTPQKQGKSTDGKGSFDDDVLMQLFQLLK